MVSGARRQQTFSRRWQLGGRQAGREGRSMDWNDGLRRHRGGTARRRAHPGAPADGRVAVDSEHDCCRARRAPHAYSGNVVRLSAAARSGQKAGGSSRSEEHTSELQSQSNLVCRLLLEKKKKKKKKL